MFSTVLLPLFCLYGRKEGRKEVTTVISENDDKKISSQNTEYSAFARMHAQFNVYYIT